MLFYDTLKIPSRELVLVDPCFIRDEIPNELAAGGIEQHEESVIVIKVTRDAEVFYEEKDECGRRISAVNLYFDGQFDLKGKDHEVIGFLGVDSGQMSYCDARHVGENWINKYYDDERIYRHKKTGRTLQYMKDFPNYAVPIPSEEGKTMNDLKESSEWERLPYSGVIDVSYNGMCHCHEDKESDIGSVNEHIIVTGTGWGDGSYPVQVYRNHKDEITCVSVRFMEDDVENDIEDDDDS